MEPNGLAVNVMGTVAGDKVVLVELVVVAVLVDVVVVLVAVIVLV
jgi:hypothetical protein